MLRTQFDGVYWNGLDRPLEEIQRSGSPRDLKIQRTIGSDEIQNEWFERQGLLLLRITDLEFEEMGIESVLEKISNLSR